MPRPFSGGTILRYPKQFGLPPGGEPDHSIGTRMEILETLGQKAVGTGPTAFWVGTLRETVIGTRVLPFLLLCRSSL
jgi:hypothetical protein